MLLVDGGVFITVNVGDPIDRCREDGFEDKDIIVDILMCSSKVNVIEKWNKQDTNWKDALAFYLRRDDISDYYAFYEDVISVTRGFKDVFFRYVLAPTRSPPSGGFIPVSAPGDNKKIEMELGYEDAKNAI